MRVTAEWRQFAEEIAIPTAALETESDLLERQTIYRLTYYAATRKHHVMEYEHDCVPVTWWDHLKQTLKDKGWLPQRARVNVRSIPTVVDVYLVCPHLYNRENEPHLRWIADGPLDI